jgi:hypothetical protein
MVHRSSSVFSKFVRSSTTDVFFFNIVILILYIINGTFGSFVNQTNATTIASSIKNSTKLVKKLAKCRYRLFHRKIFHKFFFCNR